MAIFGLGDDKATTTKEKKSSKKEAKSSKSDSSNADEARALLEKMEAKKDADECPFC